MEENYDGLYRPEIERQRTLHVNTWISHGDAIQVHVYRMYSRHAWLVAAM